MSYEHSGERERYSESEERESTEDYEKEESPEDKTSEAARDLEREEEAERAVDRASRELEDYESESRDVKEIADEASRELDSLERENEQSMEDELGHDLHETRDELHDRFVNDMERQLDGPSHKESETEEQGEDGTSSETTESSESYHDAGDGMAYALETKGGSGEAEAAETEQETQEVSEPGAQEPVEQQTESETTEEPASEKGTNRIIRQESEEGETATRTETEETHDTKTSSTSPEVSETEEDTQEVNEGLSESEPAVSKEDQYETGDLSDTVENEEQQTEGTIAETSEPETGAEEVEQDIEDAPESSKTSESEPASHEQSEAEEELIEHETPEEPEVETESLENEPSTEDESLPEDLEDFVKRVQDIMDEKMDADDDYEYVQDPLTGEMQRVPKILSEYESEEQRERRRLRNLFAELSEEERERFKELVREKAESEDERSAEEIEKQWTRLVEKAEQEREELLDKVRQVLESPDVLELLESMSEEGSHTSIEPDDEADEDESLDETLEQFLPMTNDEFQEALQRHSKLLNRKRIEQEMEHTRIYYQCREELEKTDFSHMSRREVWKHLSKKYGVPPTTLKNWFARGTLPRLLRAVRDEQAKAAGINPQKPRAPTKLSIPETFDEFLSLLARHPYLRDTKGFDKLLRDVEEYYRLREIARRSPGTSYSELSRQVDVPFGTARSWISGRSKPELLRRLLKNERLRRKMESDLQAALSMMVDPSIVYDALRPLRANKNQTLKQIVDALEKLISNKEAITIVRLKPYNSQHGPRWLLDIAKKIQRNRKKIQRMLSERMKDTEVRVGLTDNNLYLLKHNPSPWDYLELFSQERFYFKKNYQSLLVRRAIDQLGLNGDYHLSELVRQILEYKQKGRTKGRLVPNFRPEIEHLRGDVLQFMLKAQGKKLRDIESQIHRIGVGQQIVRPRILDENELKLLLARLFAIVSSDGSIAPDGRINYYEDNQLRRKRVKSFLKILGEVSTPPITKRDGNIGGFHLPNVLGRLLAKVGHPIGDKVLQGVRIPNFILNGSSKIQLAYLQELIPEEGWVTIDGKDNIRIGWARSVILFDNKKSKKFEFEQKLTTDLVKFIQKHGERKSRTSKWSDKEEVFFILNMGTLDQLKNSKDSVIASKAERLDAIVRGNPSLHIEDEKHICETNGIMIGEQSPGPIRYSASSERVSVRWQIQARSEDDVAMWGLLARPNDSRKRKKLLDWMNRHRMKVVKASKKIENSEEEIKRLSVESKEKGMSGN